MSRLSSPCCSVCGHGEPERVDTQEIEGGPYSADPSMREIVQVFKCGCGAKFAKSRLTPLEELAV
jgi:hypothetical protein